MSSTGRETQWIQSANFSIGFVDSSVVVANDTNVQEYDANNTTASNTLSTSMHSLSTKSQLVTSSSLSNLQTKATTTFIPITQNFNKSQLVSTFLQRHPIKQSNLQVFLPIVIPITLLLVSLLSFVGFYCINRRHKSQSKRQTTYPMPSPESDEVGSDNDSSSHTYSSPDDNVYDEVTSRAELDDLSQGNNDASSSDNEDGGNDNIVYVENPRSVYCTRL